MVTVDDVSYERGRGDPGQGHKSEYNNCLIDSLRQCLGIDVDRKKVRADLERTYRDAIGREQVTHTSYLDIESHWRAILQSIFKHNTSNSPRECDLDEYCIIALYATNEGHGWTNDNLNARYRLVVLNTDDIHFDPCLRKQSGSSASSGH